MDKINPLDHLGLIYKVLRLSASSFNEQIKEDLFQVGYLALHKAALRFDSSKGFSFGLYAYLVIKSDISHYLRDKVSLVRQSRNPNDDRHIVVSLDRKIKYYDGNEQTLADAIADPRTEHESWGFQEALDRIEAKNAIVIRLIIDNDMTYGEAAKSLGYGPTKVARRFWQGIAQLKSLYNGELLNND